MRSRSISLDMKIRSDVFDLAAKVLAEENGRTGDLPELPNGYYVEQDPDLLVIRRLDGSIVAAFSAFAAPPQGVRETAEGDTNREPLVSVAAPARLHVRVRFLGRFEIFHDGGVVSLGRNVKALAILRYLLARRAHPVPQDYLMGWLWPESGLKRARWSLNSA
ncbi:MAG TPA: hypothetical protein VE225_08485, partial [Rubrobacteraceae bacterium]|nr:hypothetical protein [Rubrobacteraceae bacterium]